MRKPAARLTRRHRTAKLQLSMSSLRPPWYRFSSMRGRRRHRPRPVRQCQRSRSWSCLVSRHSAATGAGHRYLRPARPHRRRDSRRRLVPHLRPAASANTVVATVPAVGTTAGVLSSISRRMRMPFPSTSTAYRNCLASLARGKLLFFYTISFW